MYKSFGTNATQILGGGAEHYCKGWEVEDEFEWWGCGGGGFVEICGNLVEICKDLVEIYGNLLEIYGNLLEICGICWRFVGDLVEIVLLEQ